jgi:mxaA protein
MTLPMNRFPAARAMLLLVAALCCPLWSPPIVAAQNLTTAPARTVQPRSFGHLIGDVLTQRILLQDGAERFDPAALPAADRIGVWFERRAPRTEIDGQGRRWLLLDYQIINAPRALIAVALPELNLVSRSGRMLKVAAWPLSIGPLTPGQVFAEGALQAMQPDRAATPMATATMLWRLKASLGALALSLCTWLGWMLWRNQSDAQRLPFARAWRELKGLERGARIEGHAGAGIDDNAAAWIALHRALNATAGSALAEASDRLFEQAPRLLPLRAQLDDFYAQSSARFFACTPLAPSARPLKLMHLCRALRRIERAS